MHNKKFQEASFILVFPKAKQSCGEFVAEESKYNLVYNRSVFVKFVNKNKFNLLKQKRESTFGKLLQKTETIVVRT